jgi:Ras-related protein Rab-1A
MEQSPQTFKRKRKTRVDNAGRGRGKGRGRNSSGVGRGVGRQMEDTDDSERDTRSEDPRLDRLDNAALAALAHPKPNTTSKYNFYVQLNPNMDQTERISKLQKTLEELRKTYLNVKGDLSAIERRRKKIRRKERERTQQTTEVAA